MLDLGMGMPSPDVFRTPALLIDKLHESIDAGDYNLYVPPEGDTACLAQIVEYENSLLPVGARPYREENVMLVPGGIQGYSAIVSTLVAVGDQILTPVPSYFSLAARSELHTSTVSFPSDHEYNFRARDLKLAIANLDRLKLMWFCQPNNPTGRYIPADELRQMIDLAADRQCHFVIDESCDNYRFTPYVPNPDNITSPQVIRIRTFSKDPNLAGYRLGYLLADPEVLDRLKRVVPVLYGNPTVMATRAVVADLQMRNGHLRDDHDDYAKVTAENHTLMRASRDYLYSALREWDQVADVILPDACYYMFARFHFDGTGPELFTRLLSEQLLNVVPGVVFGTPESEAWVRICFARPIEALQDGLDRIHRVLVDHRAPQSVNQCLQVG
ncbi:MAG: pyridoxal phosphate-dependent aminotransferase [Actinomycetota bacterium]|nr:pyridoxal phosphate-dependent aminotransferase [Actinomycetota bacterium]